MVQSKVEKEKEPPWSPWSSRSNTTKHFWRKVGGRRLSSFERQVHDDTKDQGYTNYEDYLSTKLD